MDIVPTMRGHILLVVLLATGQARAEVVWSGDYDTCDLSQWTKVQAAKDYSITVLADSGVDGTCAARFEVRQGDDPLSASGDRAEVALTHIAGREGQERWFRWYTMWPDSYISWDTWQLFTQWHHAGNTGSPPIEFFVWGEEMRLNVQDELVWSDTLVRGAWREFVVGVRFSNDADDGWIELWLDGVKVLPRIFARTMYDDANYLKQGLYRKDIITDVGVVYHDGMTMAESVEEVKPMTVTPDAGAPDADVPDATIDPAADATLPGDDGPTSGDKGPVITCTVSLRHVSPSAQLALFVGLVLALGLHRVRKNRIHLGANIRMRE